MAPGEVLKVEGQTVIIESGNLKLSVAADRVERISRSELRKYVRRESGNRFEDPVIAERKLSFRPEIDIRGHRGEEAIMIVRDFIDDAVMVGHTNLRILHGKGNGILRQLVREYLSTVNVVRSFRDESVELGGSGITLVEMDI